MNILKFKKTKKQKNKKTTALLVFVFLFSYFLIFSASVSYAQLLPQPENKNCPENYDGNCGDYELSGFTQVFIQAIQIILGLVGSLTLLFFVYGGFMMIISAGSSEKVETGKTILRNAVIGLFIVFVSWTIINFVYATLIDGGKVNNKAWYQLF